MEIKLRTSTDKACSGFYKMFYDRVGELGPGVYKVAVAEKFVKLHFTDNILQRGPGSINICADTSNPDETKTILNYLGNYGITLRKQTTNPTLLNQYIKGDGANKILEQLYTTIGIGEDRKAFKNRMLDMKQTLFNFEVSKIVYTNIRTLLGDAPLSAEVDYIPGKTEVADIVSQAFQIANIDSKGIVIKVPVTKVGVKAIRLLEEKGIRTNATLVFTREQALEAAMAGATFVSPFAGRLTKYLSQVAQDAGLEAHKGNLDYDPRFGHVGMDFVEQVAHAYALYGFDTMIIPASIRGNEKGEAPLDHLRRIWEISRFATVPLVPTIPTKVLMDPESLPWLLKFHETTKEHDRSTEFGHPLHKRGLDSFGTDANSWTGIMKEQLANW